jgi:hypothetical protein
VSSTLTQLTRNSPRLYIHSGAPAISRPICRVPSVWKDPIQPAGRPVVSRTALVLNAKTEVPWKKYRSTFSGICYEHVPNCWGSVFKPPEPYKGWPPELCYDLNGMSYKKGPSPDVPCYARTFLERLVGNFGAPATYHPDEVVVRGNCYIPSQSDDTVPLLSDY